jgi:3-phosphoglycerate kinase
VVIVESKFFDVQDEQKMIEIKQDFLKGLKKGIGRKFIKTKITGTTFRKKAKNLDEVRIIFLENLSRFTSNDTKDKVTDFFILGIR